ncbi:MAG: OmpA family protein [Bacteroidales bacterium]|nr:OmpA family protein [Bacteroidales bacterium]
MRDNKDKKAEQQLHKLLDEYPNYSDAYQALAEIYYAREDTSNARKNYEKYIVDEENNDVSARVRLAKLYFASHNWDKVKEQTEIILSKLNDDKLKNKIKQREKLSKEMKFIIDNLEFQKDCLEHPKPFSPLNMGSAINSVASEYLPTMTADENTLLITVLDSISDNQQEDFYISTFENGEWKPKIKIPYPLNTEDNEGAGCISPDGKYIYFTKCNSPDGLGSCDIYVSRRIGNKWTYPKNLGSNVNSKYWDTQPSIASDGRTLYFVSNRPGGYGGSDIYVTYRKKNETWTKAKNIGSVINTDGDECSPFIHPSNTILYFSSNAHLTMGGLDILFSKIDNGKFSTPENIGCPINTAGDEFGLIVTPSGKQAIYSSDMYGGYGKKDLYVFDLYPEAQPVSVTYLKGKILSKSTNQPVEADIQIIDIKTNLLIAQTTSDATTGEYLLSLPLGADYALSVMAKDFMLYSENITLSVNNNELKAQEYQQTYDIYLLPVITGANVVLNNVFFDVDSYNLLPESYAELGILMEVLSANPKIKIEISGHTDNTGSKEYNQILSERRAKSIVDYLISQGVSSMQLAFKGYGQDKPIATNDTAEGRAKNRRTEFKIIEK